jgi:hypothetical protein
VENVTKDVVLRLTTDRVSHTQIYQWQYYNSIGPGNAAAAGTTRQPHERAAAPSGPGPAGFD